MRLPVSDLLGCFYGGLKIEEVKPEERTVSPGK
jgi:hypothetical protein